MMTPAQIENLMTLLRSIDNRLAQLAASLARNEELARGALRSYRDAFSQPAESVPSLIPQSELQDHGIDGWPRVFHRPADPDPPHITAARELR